MEQYILYLVLKDIIRGLDSSYKISFNDMDENGVDCIGIYIKGAEPSLYRELGTGNYYNYTSRVQILLQCDNTKDSLMKLLSFITRIRSTLILTSNLLYNIPPGIIDENTAQNFNTNTTKKDEAKLGLSSVSLLGETDFNGKSGQGKARYSLNFRINYFIIGGI